jgi:hypothetical protein
MVKTIMALYEGYETADMVVEALIDSGFSHADIAVMSGSYWLDELEALGEKIDSAAGLIESHEVLLSLRVSDPLATRAREMICNSGPVDVRERAGGWHEDWAAYSLPVSIDRTYSEHIP